MEQTSRRIFFGLLRTKSSNDFPTTVKILSSLCKLQIQKALFRLAKGATLLVKS